MDLFFICKYSFQQKVRSSNESAHEKRRAGFADDVIILPRLSNIRNSQFVLKCSCFSVESALSMPLRCFANQSPKGFPPHQEKYGKPLGDLV